MICPMCQVESFLLELKPCLRGQDSTYLDFLAWDQFRTTQSVYWRRASAHNRRALAYLASEVCYEEWIALLGGSSIYRRHVQRVRWRALMMYQ